MRILHVTDVYRPRVGGIELFVEGLGLRQVAAGHEVTVLTGTRANGSADPAALDVVRVPLGGYIPMRALPVDLASYDVVHAHLSVVSVFTTRVAKAAARAGVPVVNTVHSMWNGREGWVRIVAAIATWDRLPQVWTSVSRNAAATIEDVLDPEAEVRVVPNAVDVDWWHAADLPRIDLPRIDLPRRASRSPRSCDWPAASARSSWSTCSPRCGSRYRPRSRCERSSWATVLWRSAPAPGSRPSASTGSP